jgi:glutamyl-tRNA synthetase
VCVCLSVRLTFCLLLTVRYLACPSVCLSVCLQDEFEQAIIADLASLGVVGDMVCHTSDSFPIIHKYAEQFIAAGHAYMDDTEQEQMQAERMAHIESKRRNSSVEENLRIFKEMCAGNPEYTSYCLRAKIDMTSLNGTMRDPVLYRSNTEVPHHRTGTKYKAYPTYDFACPIVDSIEGVSHALRTTEYNDRDEQYHWLQEKLGLRKVHIFAFGKMNFIHTVLSKRKLTWFVENGKVEGWFDPRFPTVQGCVRRGINVDALKSFILSQGASRRIITMEWDKFWAENKRVLEDIAPRFMGVADAGRVRMEVTNYTPSGADGDAFEVPLLPSKPEAGSRVMLRSNVLYIEQEDAATYKEGEEVTFLRWGNFFIDSIVRDSAGHVTDMKGRFNPDAKNFSKTKKATWLAATPGCVTCRLVEFDHLIAKAKLENEEAFQDFLNPVTMAETSATCDPLVATLPAGTVLQLERKGFYRVDKAGTADSAPVLFYIPDGKATKTLAERVKDRENKM